MNSLFASLRVAVATSVICVAGYSMAVWGVAQAVAPEAANGSLIIGQDGNVLGSRQIAQSFTEPGYFWPRPSAVDYNGAGAGGSNKSPTSQDLVDRATETVASYNASPESPLPADLVAASGAGLDPHISEAGALYQLDRIAQARGIDQSQLAALVARLAFSPGGVFTPERIVNVLELNLALDRS